MRMYDIIQKKRDGGVLTEQEIQWFISSYVKGEIPDYQVAALCMAIYFRGMNLEETTALTFAVRDSGDCLDFSEINGLRVDKHSTGGVGDKTSLVVAPIVASLGVKVAKMSGRGLGHTGGTIDKLEAIPGFRTDMPVEEFKSIVNGVGIAIVGQNAELAPADDECIVLDVKTGSGSFMKTLEKSRELAEWMVAIGKKAGKRMRALITDMGTPLGYAIGNSLEVVEAIHTLHGKGPQDLTELCVALSAHILVLAEKGDYAQCEKMVRGAIADGTGLQTFADMVEAQGGNKDWILHPENFPVAKYSHTVVAQECGYITGVDAEGYGVASLLLGAGRNTKEDVIDPTAGIYLLAKTGDYVEKGAPIATLYSGRVDRFAVAEERLLKATQMGKTAPA